MGYPAADLPEDVDRREGLQRPKSPLNGNVAGTSIGIGALFHVAPMLGASADGRRIAAMLSRKNGEAPSPSSFVQLSDTHVGFSGPPNPLGTQAFERAIARRD